MEATGRTCTPRPSADEPSVSRSVNGTPSQAHLDVLQCQILRTGSAVDVELRRSTRHKAEDTLDCGDGGVDVDIEMVRSDRLGEIFRSLPRLRSRVFGAHVAGMEDSASELARVGRDVRRVVWFPRHTPRIVNDLLICVSVETFWRHFTHFRLEPLR